MAILSIRYLGDPLLRRTAEPVASIDDEVRQLMDDMLETMYAAEGVGLAAPQVGLSRRIIVVDVRQENVPPFGLVNPEILETSADVDRAEEGCLSVPGLREIVERPARATVSALDRDGVPVRIEAQGLLARVLQHEVDHLNGILFLDRVSPLKRQMLLKRWKKTRPVV
ncbi:MAG: peptide deformylase [Gemmatimonadetes bacterium]|nr:peptide deformylase [Gemmatimonadota bacterium]